mgnify:FL=1
MPRRHYLVTYDVADDKRRTRLFDYLQGEGDHAQYSVFLCDLDRAELATVRARATEIIDHRRDQVLILDLGPAEQPLAHGLEVLGKPYQPLIRTIVV